MGDKESYILGKPFDMMYKIMTGIEKNIDLQLINSSLRKEIIDKLKKAIAL